ncbi:ThiF family adenylyltransferase [Flavisolibacter nicotianae]|uniref:ThiF family adenylyltransferase n=1 Tax=Flavisolibacter nicotianae TaxID=2364882 RepID=UPI000EB5776C|nr:ThiF family adenylyltransferase [Flavisolibacter nicotianae]
MSQQLINHSPDLKKLRDEGYEIEIQGGHLVVRHIPYVNSTKQVCFGTLVTNLDMVSVTRTARPGTHVIYFQGAHPCNKDGSILSAIHHQTHTQSIGPNLVVQHSFSNKPIKGYADYYEKVTRYAEIISAPAKAIDCSVTAQTFKAVVDTDEHSVLKFVDTNSSRSNLYEVMKKLQGQKIAIIGLGGTGAYILDAIAKTPVQEIHLFDGDLYLLHNAFRSPGAPTKEVLDRQMKKVHYYQELYSNFHKNIIAHDYYMIEERLHELEEMTYVFVAVDKGSVKEPWLKYFVDKGLAFIDVGMGIHKIDDKLIGILRITTATKDKNDHLEHRIALADDDGDEYQSNIQISELNALNGSLAVVKWKKLCGFYQDLEEEHHTTYSINVSQLLNEDNAA